MTEREALETVVEISHKMYERHMVTTYEGNFSIKNHDRIYITPTSFCKGNLTTDKIVILDLEGARISTGLKQSSEYLLHLDLYRLRPDITAVLHDHSPFATAYALCRKPIQTRSYFEPIILFDKIPVCNYGITGSEAIFKDIVNYANASDIFLLANHGLVSIHADPFKAFYQAEAAEAIAKTLTIAHLLGGEHPLNQSDINELYHLRSKLTGRSEIEI
ncbi:MAG: class II aldolase/adducin family protein [Eubacteriales bacterium]|nr:class II aldolase/adducin family protein [Eubacteriales bacterium]